jgi:queuine/archaeosine tRNA-ribosyltransferase
VICCKNTKTSQRHGGAFKKWGRVEIMNTKRQVIKWDQLLFGFKGSVHTASAPLPVILLLHIGQGSPPSTSLNMYQTSFKKNPFDMVWKVKDTYFMNSERMAMNWQLGQRVRFSLITCMPYDNHGRKFKIISCLTSKWNSYCNDAHGNMLFALNAHQQRRWNGCVAERTRG